MGVIAALLLFGGLSDQIGRRRTLLPGVAFSALSAVVFLIANDVGPLLVGRVLIAGMSVVALGLAVSSLALLVAGGMVAGFGQGMSFRAGLTAVNLAAPVGARA